MKRIIRTISFMAVFMLLQGGCVTTQDTREAMRQHEDFLLLKEELTRTKGRLEALETEYQRLLREVDAMQGASYGSENAAGAAQARMDELERRFNSMEASRAKDRQAIVEQLSGRISEIMGGESGRKSAPRQAGNAVGYEHTVQEGETLSAIAAAYKIRVSAIVDANSLKDQNTIHKGQKLFIPKP